MKTLIIDAGHGGEDPGAIGTLYEKGKEKTYKEADFTFDIAKRLWAKLTPKYSVFLTRKENETKSLNDRCLLAKKLKADIFLSVHINSATDSRAYGYEAFCVRTPLEEYSKFKFKSQVLRDMILEELEKEFPNWGNRGGKEANFQVLKYVPCVSVLVELGFISNPNDLQFLLKEEVREKMSLALMRAINSFIISTVKGGEILWIK